MYLTEDYFRIESKTGILYTDSEKSRQDQDVTAVDSSKLYLSFPEKVEKKCNICEFPEPDFITNQLKSLRTTSY
jgi:hypothetical protein